MKVTIDGLTKQYEENFAVHNFSAELDDGKLICLLGPSGCGKSTTLFMLAGITKPTSGRILFDGEDVTNQAPEKRCIGLVFQNYALYPHMTVLENICFPLEVKKVPKKERIARAKEIAKQVHIDDLLSRRPSELSGGQQQRVAIARALVKQPRLLLLDEPLSNLDARLRIEMREEIRRIQQSTGVTTVFVTHDQEEAMSISDRILLMRKGVVMQYDMPQKLYDDPVNDFVADFLGTPPINKLQATVKNGQICLDEGGQNVQFPNPPALREGQKLFLSVRAESFYLTDGAAACTGVLEQTYVMGKERLALLKIGGRDCRAYISDVGDYQPGQTLPLGIKTTGAFLFDAETGARLS